MLTKDNLKQFISYVFVGGTAALVEWASFSLALYVFGMNHLMATIVSFLIATFVNWILGRKLTFKDSCRDYSLIKDCLQVYLASLMGLGINLLLMFVFVDVWQWQPLLSKVLATGIVFIWNFLIRKFFIYRKKDAEK